MGNSSQIPHPEKNPQLCKADYMCNAVFAVAKIELALYIGEGASLHESALVAQHMQEAINRAYHAAIQEAGLNITGPLTKPPVFGEGLRDDNPFNPDPDES